MSTPLERLVAYLKAAHIDLRLFLTGKANPDLPPLRLRFVGDGDFRAVGDQLAGQLVSAGGLQPTDRVLDIGCGVGRVALSLTRYLQPPGTYDGFDIVRPAIRWCRRAITPRHPSFRFHWANVYNANYNWRGIPAARYRFPFSDGSFDFTFATSVIWHSKRRNSTFVRPGAF